MRFVAVCARLRISQFRFGLSHSRAIRKEPCMRTELCDFLGIEYPIIQGAMAHITDGKFEKERGGWNLKERGVFCAP